MKIEGSSQSPGNRNSHKSYTEDPDASEFPSIYQSSHDAQVKADAFSRAIAHLNKQKQIKHSF